MLRATVKQVEGFSWIGKSNSNHWVAMDGPQKAGADDGASRPKELLLIALGGCTAFDVQLVLGKRRVHPSRFEVELEAEEASEHPRVFTEVRVTYRFEGDGIPVADLERAIRLSEEKYCAVTAMLRRSFPIRWRATLNGEEVAKGDSKHESRTTAV